jgi:serine/threonine-protein kinase
MAMIDTQQTTEFSQSAIAKNFPAVSPAVVPASKAFPGGRSLLVQHPGSQTIHVSQFLEMFRWRLIAMLSLGVVIWGMILTLGATRLDRVYSPEVIGWGGISMIGSVVLGWSVLILLLSLRREWSLPWLRACEFAILAPLVGMLGMSRVYELLASETGGFTGVDFLLSARTQNGFGWMVALVIWGMVFPHPLKRLILLNGLIIACPVLIDLILILLEPKRASILVLPGLINAQMLIFGCFVSLFGLKQLLTLQREIDTAQELIREARDLGAYHLKKQIGRGGMAQVFLAEHRLLKRPCAVKLINPEFAANPLALQRFEREAQATAQLKHPNTVDVFDFGRTEDGTIYYVMELLDGLSLDDIVRKFGPLPSGRVIHLLLQLCGALREAHQAGLIHRDIKPSNVLLCRHGGMFDVVKLVDFGLVRFEKLNPGLGHLTQVGAVTGTPDYISPEQVEGDDADQRSDLYSLGGTAYFLLTGRPPFLGNNTVEILFAHLHEPVEPLSRRSRLSTQLEGTIHRLLLKSPHDRFQTIDELEAALKNCTDRPWTAQDAIDWWKEREMNPSN